MTLPISFDEVGYFNNEYRGDFIITLGVIYYFPHTRVSASHNSSELGGKETIERISLIGTFVPLVGMAPWAYEIVDKSVKLGKFIKRSVAPTINKPRIRSIRLWIGNESNEQLQEKLDGYIAARKAERLEFDEDSIPKPIRFVASEMENASFGLKFKFDAKFDNHDFRVNPIRRSLLRRALKEGGFLQ
jgi:hypothetical protein